MMTQITHERRSHTDEEQRKKLRMKSHEGILFCIKRFICQKLIFLCPFFSHKQTKAKENYTLSIQYTI